MINSILFDVFRALVLLMRKTACPHQMSSPVARQRLDQLIKITHGEGNSALEPVAGAIGASFAGQKNLALW